MLNTVKLTIWLKLTITGKFQFKIPKTLEKTN